MNGSQTTIYPLRKTLLYLGAFLIVMFVFAYVLYQARFILIGPEVVLTDPPKTVQEVRVIDLHGRATNITHLSLNGREIFTDEHGYFKEALVLENGYTVATLVATDRYGRATEVVTPFVFTPMTRLP